MKKISTEIYKEALGKMRFLYYKNYFSCVNGTYSDLTSKMFNIVNKVRPTKTIRGKNDTSEWFDGEIAEKIAGWYKLFIKF